MLPVVSMARSVCICSVKTFSFRMSFVSWVPFQPSPIAAVVSVCTRRTERRARRGETKLVLSDLLTWSLMSCNTLL